MKQLTPEIKSRIFAAHHKQIAKYHEKEGKSIIDTTFIHFSNLANWSILLNPLTSITDEHAIEAAKLATKVYAESQQKYIDENITYSVKERNEDGIVIQYGNFAELEIDFKECDIMCFHDVIGKVSAAIDKIHGEEKFLFSRSLFFAYEYLRSIGYALPFTTSIDGKPVTFRVEELAEAGVYKLT